MNLPLETRWHEDHSFGQEQKRSGEIRTFIVIIVTVLTMAVEITCGVLFGSLAVLADGLHMAAHAAALSVTAFAYVYARRHAHDSQFNFGTGKANALGGFASAIILLGFSLLMAWESIERLIHPLPIAFNESIGVAVAGLVVNLICIFILDHPHHHPSPHAPHTTPHHHEDSSSERQHDHNLQAAYLHVVTDALTSILAIVALVVGKYTNTPFWDTLVGFLGVILVTRWSFSLIASTSSILMDRQAAPHIFAAIRAAIETNDGNRIKDLHVWCIGPRLYAVELVIVASDSQCPEHYKRLLPMELGIAHLVLEVHQGT